MKDYNDKAVLTSTIFIVTVILILVLVNPFKRRVPEGLPTSYYDYVDQVIESESPILIYSDTINLNEHIEHISLNNMEDSIPGTSSKMIYIIIDMVKYKDNYDDNTIINDLIDNTCHRIVIANYKKSNSNISIGSLDKQDLDSDLIFMKNLSICSNDESLNINGTDFPDDLFLNFAIMRRIVAETKE